MSRRQTQRSALTAIVASCVLVIFSATGLLAGSVASGLAAGRPTTQPTSSGGTSATYSAGTANNLPTTTATTVASTQLVSSSFVLTLTAAPNPASSSRPVHVTVRASAQGSDTPVPGITCRLEAPQAGGTALMSSWPPAKVTDGTGTASWDLNLAGVPAGFYGIGVTSVGTSYTYHSQINITVTTGS